MKHDNITSFERPREQRELWNFSYPHQVVRDPAMTVEEKRAILAGWASDAHSVESLPILRHLPGTPFPITFSSIMDAMAVLDRLSCANDDDPPPSPRAKRPRPGETTHREAA